MRASDLLDGGEAEARSGETTVAGVVATVIGREDRLALIDQDTGTVILDAKRHALLLDAHR